MDLGGLAMLSTPGCPVGFWTSSKLKIRWLLQSALVPEGRRRRAIHFCTDGIGGKQRVYNRYYSMLHCLVYEAEWTHRAREGMVAMVKL